MYMACQFWLLEGPERAGATQVHLARKCSWGRQLAVSSNSKQ